MNSACKKKKTLVQKKSLGDFTVFGKKMKKLLKIKIKISIVSLDILILFMQGRGAGF